MKKVALCFTCFFALLAIGCSSEDLNTTVGDTNTNNGNQSPELTHIPDANFELFLMEQGLDDTLDGYVKKEKISGLSTLQISGRAISDLTGIEDFSSLKKLDCSDNLISTLDLTNNSDLEILECQQNNLTTIDIQGLHRLQIVQCQMNQLQIIELIDLPKLMLLNCQMNQLSSLDTSQIPALMKLTCNDNELQSLILESSYSLTTLACQNNQLTSLNLSNNEHLRTLNCSNNNLSFLNISNGHNALLTTLDARDNTINCIQIDYNFTPPMCSDEQPSWCKDVFTEWCFDSGRFYPFTNLILP